MMLTTNLPNTPKRLGELSGPIGYVQRLIVTLRFGESAAHSSRPRQPAPEGCFRNSETPSRRAGRCC